VYRILRRIFGRNKQEATIDWRQLTQVHMARSFIILVVTEYYLDDRIKERKRTGPVGSVGEMKNA
jgi:hypothetical protein